MVRAHEAVVSIFEVGLESDNGFCCQLFNLSLDVANVSAPCSQLFVYVRQQLLRRVVIAAHKGRVRLLELFGILVERVVGQVHVEVAQVHAVGLLVVLLTRKDKTRTVSRSVRLSHEKEIIRLYRYQLQEQARCKVFESRLF